MITFKTFLEMQDPLEHVQELMAIRELLGFNNTDAQWILDWLHSDDDSYEFLPDHLSQAIADAVSEDADVTQLPDHEAAPIVKDWLRKEARKIGHATEVSESAAGDPLHDLEQELKLVQTYKIKRSDAEKLHASINIVGDFYAMSNKAVQMILDAHPDVTDVEHAPIQMDSLADAVVAKAGINFTYDGRFDDI